RPGPIRRATRSPRRSVQPAIRLCRTRHGRRPSAFRCEERNWWRPLLANRGSPAWCRPGERAEEFAVSQGRTWGLISAVAIVRDSFCYVSIAETEGDRKKQRARAGRVNALSWM